MEVLTGASVRELGFCLCGAPLRGQTCGKTECVREAQGAPSRRPKSREHRAAISRGMRNVDAATRRRMSEAAKRGAARRWELWRAQTH